MQKEANRCKLLVDCAALRGFCWTVAPYKILQRALCYELSNEDVQEVLTQILEKWPKMK